MKTRISSHYQHDAAHFAFPRRSGLSRHHFEDPVRPMRKRVIALVIGCIAVLVIMHLVTATFPP